MPPREPLSWFKFEPRAFLASRKVGRMTLRERGAYITLLCESWLRGGGLPVGIEELAEILDESEEATAELLSGR